MMSRRVKERVCRSIEDESDDDSMEDAKDEALTSLITHCEPDHGVTYRESKGTNMS